MYTLLKIIYRSIIYFYKRLLCGYIFHFQKYTIEDVVPINNSFELFITHDYSGGTHIYEHNYISDRDNVIVLRNLSYRKDFLFSIENHFLHKKVYIKPNKLFNFFETQHFTVVTINSFVKNNSFRDIIKILIEKQTKDNIFIRYNVHDFHCICPNYTLISNNKYCNINCNKQICKFDRFFIKNIKYIDKWRETWNNFFYFVSEIVCFSQSSKEIIQSIYHDINNKIKIIPHSLSYCNFYPINVKGLDFHVGIIGNLTTQEKGLLIIKKFLKYAAKNKIKVTIIGKMHFWDKIYSPYIVYRNSYKLEELQLIIEYEKVTNVLFPSICPETFSYLVSELMTMNMPIVCFNVGAQAEKITNYALGCICQSINPENILYALKKQYTEI